MQITDVAPVSAPLADDASTRPTISASAVLAARRVRALEQAVCDLRASLEGAAGTAMDDTERRAQIVRLLSEVTLFRLALADRA
jgi:hypothetical protein